jgi:hypothetical protein
MIQTPKFKLSRLSPTSKTLSSSPISANGSTADQHILYPATIPKLVGQEAPSPKSDVAKPLKNPKSPQFLRLQTKTLLVLSEATLSHPV